MPEYVLLPEAKLIDHRCEPVVDAFFAIIVRVAGVSVVDMPTAYPFDASRHEASTKIRAALRTLNAARKRIYILSCGFRESILPLLEQELNLFKGFLVNEGSVCSLCVELVFMTPVCELFERNGRISVSLLVSAIYWVRGLQRNLLKK